MIYILIATLVFLALLAAVYYYDQYKLRRLLRNETETERRKELMRTAGHTPLLPEKPRLHFANLPPAKPREEAPKYNRGYPIAAQPPKTTRPNKTPDVSRDQEVIAVLVPYFENVDPEPAPAQHSHHDSAPSHYTGPAEACNAESFASDSRSSYRCDSGSSYSDSSSSTSSDSGSSYSDSGSSSSSSFGD